MNNAKIQPNHSANNFEKKLVERQNKRAYDAIRPLTIKQGVLPNANGSALICLGNTHILCSASIVTGVPHFRQNNPSGWLTAQYGMLPTSTHTRVEREAILGKQNSRTQEIQRLIGRSLRAVTNLNYFKNKTIHIDCDVISADGGTRTASITGAYIALIDAIIKNGITKSSDIIDVVKPIAAISVGIVNGTYLLDLDYMEDSSAENDLNVVMDTNFHIIEIQGTAERNPYTKEDFKKMLDLSEKGIKELMAFQQAILKKVKKEIQ